MRMVIAAADGIRGCYCPRCPCSSMRLRPPHLRPIYTIDAHDRLVEVNPPFVASLPYSGGANTLIGRPIWDFVAGELTRRLWEVLYERVRVAGAPLFVPLRADTANERRVIDVELHPAPDRSVRHVRECLWTEARPAVALLDSNYPRDSRALLRCAWCARVQVRLGTWQEIEDAQFALGIVAAETLPTIQDTACASCKQSVLKTFPARVA
jgi:hypothetical protein